MKSFFKPDQYEEYLSVQKKYWSVKKFKERGVYEYHSIFSSLSEDGIIKDNFKEGVCLGSRNRHESESFEALFNRSNINAKIFSLDLDESADVDYHYDFSNLPDEWTDRFDFIYTNCLDHTFDLKSSIIEWKRVLSPDDGILVLGLSPQNIDSISGKRYFDEQNCTLVNVSEFENFIKSNFREVNFYEDVHNSTKEFFQITREKTLYKYWVCKK